jgi:trehalose 6-phosphate phosphatase
VTPAVQRIAEARDRTGILLDYDGTLAPIVTRPEEAAPAPGAREAIRALVGRFRLVGVVSGRPADELARLLDVEGVHFEGLYGLPPTPGTPDALLGRVDAAAHRIPGAWVEPKGITVAVHYRQADDPGMAREVLVSSLAPLAADAGFDLIEGKMVFELAPAGESRKGGVVQRLVRENELQGALYAGDDLPDLEAFAALDRLAADGLATAKVAVGGAELPEPLASTADMVVETPAHLVDLLRTLAAA